MSHQPEPVATLTPLKRAFLALEEARSRVKALEQAAREPIAIIGLGCRVPGGGDDSDSFWRLMRDGVDAIGPVPADRWDVDALYDADPEAPGRIATREGGFLGPVDGFDPGFFGIAPREAQGMDPQQRLLLEVSWEALEHAGQAPSRLERSATGVFVGLCASDYAYLQLNSRDPALLDAHFTSGIAHSIVSGRLSYLLGLQGPSITLDTACSSSLVAVHLACQSLRSGECRMALAGGVNLILSPDLYIALSHSRMLAPDGRCKTFDASADGFARGEGCGIVVLKRLSDAQADGDRVLALIRGSAVNQDGPSSGLTAPNGPAQEAVVRQALANAGVAPRQVGFIEAHGTGTQLGDPLEVQALGAVFGADRDPARPLLLGSVKTNIGHLEGAAGVTGLIKLVLALQQRRIPAHLHFRTPSPHIPWAELPLRVPTQLTDWEPIDGRRIGGVSSFGFSGTNAHAVLEEAPAAAPVAASEHPAWLFVLSARDEVALMALAQRHAAALEGRADADLADICHTVGVGRSHFAVRAATVVRSIDELRRRLNALASGASADGLRSARVTRRDPPRIAFLFTGQGSQYAGMARGLYDVAPVFREALDRCAALLEPQLARPLLELLFHTDGPTTALDETACTQPALFAVEYALTQLWHSWGVTPSVVMGHSVGEVVAACVAGVLSLPDALRLIVRRGRLMQDLPAGGAMAAIFAPEQRVAQALAAHAGSVAVAAVNGPAQTVISGAAASVDAVCQALLAQGVRCQPLTVSHAFHSPLMEPMLAAFEREAAQVELCAPRLRLISNLSGRLADAGEITQPAYWRRHVREPVRFGDGLAALQAMRPDCGIEIGPHPTLLGFVNAAAETPAAPTQWLASLRKGRCDWEQMLESLASLYLAGLDVDWPGLVRGTRRRIVDLPTYAFQRERCWFQVRPALLVEPVRGRSTGHPLLGARLRSAGSEVIYESHLGADRPGFMRQHRVQGRVVVPGTAWLDTLLAAGRDRLSTDSVSVEDVTVREAMLLDDDGALRTLQVVCGAARDGALPVTLCSLAADAADSAPWTTHVTALLRAGTAPLAASMPLAELRQRCPEAVTPADFYADFERRGLAFGPAFRSIRHLWRGEMQALAEVELADDLAGELAQHTVHPVLLDGCLQALAAALPNAGVDDLFLPLAFSRFTLLAKPGTRCWSHVTVHPGAGDSRRAELKVYDADGTLVAELADVQLKRVSRDALARLGERWLDECLYETLWRPAALEGAPFDAGFSLPALASAAGLAEGELHRSAGLDAYDIFLPQFEALCADYVVQALQRLGWAPRVGEVHASAALADRLRVQPRHWRLFERLLAILAEAGWLARGPQGWTVLRAWAEAPMPAPRLELERLLATYPAAAAELEMTGRVAAEFAEALRGEREPMQLLFPGGSLDSAERMYRDAPTAKFYNGLIGEVMAAAAAAHADDRPLRILEIGAGTGGTTAHVLPRLPAQRVQYTFTDVGPLFVARARERFEALGFMRFNVLDLERDPASQGFAANGFDVVIASNVVHATTDLRRTLARVRSLLASGGVLAMLEVTAAQPWFDLTVGLTEGWWAFEDIDLRPDYATLPRERWLSLLGECGFDAVTALPAEPPSTGTLALQSLLLARAAAPARRAAAGEWLLFADQGGVSEALAGRLRECGEPCTLVRPAQGFAADADGFTINPAAPADHRRLLDELRSAGRSLRGVLHAWSLDSLASDGMTQADLALAQTRGAWSTMLLAQALVTQNPVPRLWILSRGAQAAAAADRGLAPSQAPVWGFGKALALEHPELRCVCIDLDPAASTTQIDALLAELDEPGDEAQVALREGGRRVARLTRLRRTASAVPAGTGSARGSGSWRLLPATPGSLERFERQSSVRRLPGAGQVEIAVEATGLNFKDVLNVLGMYPGEPGPLGGECAGRVVAVGAGVTHVRPGDEVLALAGGSFASHVVARAEFVQPRPAGMSAEDGAAFAIAFVTAEFCLFHLAGLRAGERVLIHAAAGGVGMAAVRLALRAGAEVFATAGSEWKRDLLRAMGVHEVLDSRSTAFASRIMSLTQDRGVDVVLNSLSGDAIEASFGVLARGGRFIEIGKRGIKDAAWVDARDRDLKYHVVDWGETGERDPALIGGILARLVDELRRGTLCPLPRHVFTLDEAPRAFRFMAQARHAGRIVLRHGAPAPVAIRREGTYLVTGGLAGLGPVVARWLAQQGAGRIVLVGRRGPTPELMPLLDELRAGGATVLAEALDITDEAGLRALLARLRADGPPLRGVLHGAGVLDNAVLQQQQVARFERVFGPKVRGAWLLDTLTRSDPLDCFVLFSSVAAVLGAAGQSNHSAANAFLDALAHERRGRGLPGLSINWGAWSEAGAAASTEVGERLAAQGLGGLSSAQGLQALARLLNDGSAQAAVLPVNWQRYLQQLGRATPPAFLQEVAGLAMSSVAAGPTTPAQAAATGIDWLAQLAAAPVGRRHTLVAGFVRERALRALGVDPSRPVDPRTPLGELGLDSLLAVELRNTLGTALGRSLPATLLFDYPTIATLTDYLLSDVLPRPEAAPDDAPPAAIVRALPAAALVGSIEDLSDEEVDRQLAARSRRKA